MGGRSPVPGAAAVLASLIACNPSPSSAVRSPSPIATTSATPAARSPGPSAVAASIELQKLDARYVPTGELASADGAVLWSAGAASPSEIWRYVPGSSGPERIYASPRAQSIITAVVGSASGYAFVELSEPAFGDGGWRVWFVRGSGAAPVELARGVAKRAGTAPTIAMDDAHIAWAGFDEPPGGDVSRLAVASTGDPENVTTLLERPVRESLLWYPALHGTELWYGTIHGDFDMTGLDAEFHLETLDLADPGAPPVRFAGAGNDFDPAVNDHYVVWKTNTPGDSALNWGTLHVLDRQSRAVTTVPVEHANRPSIGDRYVAFDEILHRRLAVYDPVTGTVLDLAPATPDGGAGSVLYGGESLSGRLLTFLVQGADGSGVPRLGWAILPE